MPPVVLVALVALFKPAQVTLLLLKDTTIGLGCDRLATFMLRQPSASVTVSAYPPAINPVILLVVLPLLQS